ncbi:hypothetical protein XENORESO_012774 [Xenotaenia resolanae]|uniref:Uncharacterized protein n=1 Tax=Xenotaenia resolanae TaxID=208358 RepID=A0ABV0XA90_9TELE
MCNAGRDTPQKTCSSICSKRCLIFLPLTVFSVSVYHIKSQDTLKFGLHGGAVGSTVALQQKGPGFDSWPGVFLHGVCMLSACSPHASVGSHWVLWLPPTVQRHAC